MGHIRPSSSDFTSSVVLVKNKDISMRMCIEYMALNKYMINNMYPLLRINGIMYEMHRVVYLLNIDLRSCYHQIRVREKDIHKTYFRFDYGNYVFLFMPFWLTNEPTTFHSSMNHLF
jgi:hypothetical protein